MSSYKDLQKSHKWFAVSLLDTLSFSNCVKESQFLRKKYTLEQDFVDFFDV